MLSVCVIICPQKELLSVRAELQSVREVSVLCWTAVLCVVYNSQSCFSLPHSFSCPLYIVLPLPPSFVISGAPQELDKKFSDTAQYVNMRKMLSSKNEQIKELRAQLKK